MARSLAAADLCPDHAVVSGAVRTRQTWAAMEDACGGCEVSFDDSLYSASAETVIDVLRLVPADVETLMYVGHNPAAEYIVAVLSDGEGDPEALRAVISGMAPATAAVFEIDGPWAELGPGSGRVLAVFRPPGA